MVKVRENTQSIAAGTFDAEAWLATIDRRTVQQGNDTLADACRFVQAHRTEKRRDCAHFCIDHGLRMVELLTELQAEDETLAAALLYPFVEYATLPLESVEKQFGSNIAKLISGVQKMQVTRTLFNDRGQRMQTQEEQSQSLRKMLLAMIEDVRVVLIKLVDSVYSLHIARDFSDADRLSLAQETMDLYAPLANRLGIGHLKWELEDLAFRYLNPEEYKRIAKLLAERRLDRQEYIHDVIGQLDDELKSEGINADIYGRAKHIYSIWRKMQRKNLSYTEIYDVRAVRVMVDNVKDCYTALGTVHSLWTHIPREFDDYIATPKENGYRSLHTAVIGPEGKSLEVQIRTHAMHEEAELGVAAHWQYKEGAKQKERQNLDEKISWLRQVLDWQSEIADADEFVDELHSQAFDNRVYAFTPAGDVIELGKGSTPLDFAYQIHTELGHRCRGAKVNGKIVPLTYQVRSSDTIEILANKTGEPSRDWLSPQSGYLKSPRARSKVHLWFKQQDYDKNLTEGRYELERELQRLGITDVDADALAPKFNYKKGEDLLAAIGAGDVRASQVIRAAEELIAPREKADELPVLRPRQRNRSNEKVGVQVQGESNLLTQIAKCCKPVPGDPVVGYITTTRGISIHRADCANIFSAKETAGDRVIEVQWNPAESNQTYALDVFILAYDRQGLLRDITREFATQSVNLIGLNTRSDKESNMAELRATLEVSCLDQLSKVLTKIAQIPNVVEVKRL